MQAESDSIQKRVLLIDDHEDGRTALSGVLALEGFHVAEAESLTDASAKLRSGSFDLVILDVQLGEESGLDLVPEIRGSQPEAKLALFTGDSRVGSSDADLVIVKGAEPSTMLREIRAVLLS